MNLVLTRLLTNKTLKCCLIQVVFSSDSRFVNTIFFLITWPFILNCKNNEANQIKPVRFHGTNLTRLAHRLPKNYNTYYVNIVFKQLAFIIIHKITVVAYLNKQLPYLKTKYWLLRSLASIQGFTFQISHQSISSLSYRHGQIDKEPNVWHCNTTLCRSFYSYSNTILSVLIV